MAVKYSRVVPKDFRMILRSFGIAPKFFRILVKSFKEVRQYPRRNELASTSSVSDSI